MKQPRLKQHCDWSNQVRCNSTMQVGYVIRVHYMSREIYVNVCTQPTSAVILLSAKSGKIFQDAIMTELVLCFQLGFDFLIVENSDDCEEVACSFNKLCSPPIKSRTNFRKPMKMKNFRIPYCVLLYCYPPYEGFMFFGRNARCTS